MPKPLSEKAQRIVFGTLIVVLVAFGVYLSTGGFSSVNEGQQAGKQPENLNGEDGENSTRLPSPIPTTATEDMDVLDWLPLKEKEIKVAAANAQAFTAAYGTIDYSKPQEYYYGSMENLATKEYAKTLAKSSGAAALWGEKAEEDTVSEGRASINSIRSFDHKSVVFVIQAQSITEDTGGTEEELGEFAVTVVQEGSEWKVHDFQSADLANLGGG